MKNYDFQRTGDARIHPEWLQLEADIETNRRRRGMQQRLLIAALGLVLVAGVIAAALIGASSLEWPAAADAAPFDQETPIAP